MRRFSSLLFAGAATATGCTTGDFCVTRCNDENNNNRAAMTISVDKDYMDSHHADLSSAFALSGNDYTLTLQAGDAALNLNMADSDYIFLEYELATGQVDVAGATNIYFAGRTTTFKCKYPRSINVGGNYTVTDEPDPSPYEETGFLQYDFTTTLASGRTTVEIVKQHGIPGLEANVQNCAVTYASMPDDIVYPIRNQPTWGDTDSCIDNRIGTTFTYANGGATIDWRTFHFNVPNASAISQEHNIACNIEVSETLSVSSPSDCGCHDYASCDFQRLGDWNQWTSCDVACGGGTRTRTRLCERGTCLPTDLSESEDCAMQGCLDAWTAWGSCSRDCGGGQQSRTRTCTGGTCTEDLSEDQTCNQYSCTPTVCFTLQMDTNVPSSYAMTGDPVNLYYRDWYVSAALVTMSGTNEDTQPQETCQSNVQLYHMFTLRADGNNGVSVKKLEVHVDGILTYEKSGFAFDGNGICTGDHSGEPSYEYIRFLGNGQEYDSNC